jgi:hypothetical protein
VRTEEVLGEYGGQMASFEWVFSPRGQDGRPMQLFNRKTGALNPAVTEAWQKYDIRRKLAREWKTLEPKLRGKIHVFCGSEDTFHLEEAASMLCDFLKSVKADATCEIIPGRDHMNLYRREEKHYPEGLQQRIAVEMEARYKATLPSPARKQEGARMGPRPAERDEYARGRAGRINALGGLLRERYNKRFNFPEEYPLVRKNQVPAGRQPGPHGVDQRAAAPEGAAGPATRSADAQADRA